MITHRRGEEGRGGNEPPGGSNGGGGGRAPPAIPRVPPMPSATSPRFEVLTGTGERTSLLQRTHDSILEPRESHGPLEREDGRLYLLRGEKS